MGRPALLHTDVVAWLILGYLYANPDAKDAVPAQNKQPGEGSVSAVMSVELPSQ